MGIVNNPWVVGIGTGVLSGLLVTWVLSLFITRKKDREHQQLVSNANREVIYSIRAGIPEGSLPGAVVVDSLINSTARKYQVQPSELYQAKELSEELIKEVMDSSFLPAQKKVEYCEDIAQIGSERDEINLNLEEQRVQIQVQGRRATRVEQITAIMAGLASAVTAGIAAAVTVFPTVENSVLQFRHSLFESANVVFPMILLTAFLFALFDRLFRVVIKKRQEGPTMKK